MLHSLTLLYVHPRLTLNRLRLLADCLAHCAVPCIDSMQEAAAAFCRTTTSTPTGPLLTERCSLQSLSSREFEEETEGDSSNVSSQASCAARASSAHLLEDDTTSRPQQPPSADQPDLAQLCTAWLPSTELSERRCLSGADVHRAHVGQAKASNLSVPACRNEDLRQEASGSQSLSSQECEDESEGDSSNLSGETEAAFAVRRSTSPPDGDSTGQLQQGPSAGQASRLRAAWQDMQLMAHHDEEPLIIKQPQPQPQPPASDVTQLGKAQPNADGGKLGLTLRSPFLRLRTAWSSGGPAPEDASLHAAALSSDEQLSDMLSARSTQQHPFWMHFCNSPALERRFEFWHNQRALRVIQQYWYIWRLRISCMQDFCQAALSVHHHDACLASLLGLLQYCCSITCHACRLHDTPAAK